MFDIPRYLTSSQNSIPEVKIFDLRNLGLKVSMAFEWRRDGTGRKESREHEASDEARQDGRSKERRV